MHRVRDRLHLSVSHILSSRRRLSVPSPDLLLAFSLFWILAGVYNLTYLGLFRSSDEQIMFATLDSLVKRGDLAINQLYWAHDAGHYLAVDRLVGYFEPGQVFAAIPFYVWGRLLGGTVYGTFFLNLWVTAANAALLFLLGRTLRYQRSVAVIAALVYGLATPAWVYSRSFFREPLVSFCLLLAFFLLLQYHKNGRSWVVLLASGLAVAFATSVKLAAIIFLPAWLWLVGVYVADRRGLRSDPLSPIHVVIVVLLALICIVFAGILLFQGSDNVIALYRFAVIPEMLSLLVEPRRLGLAAFGLTLSPIRGLFLYAPVLLLSLASLRMFWKRHRFEARAILLFVLSLFVAYVFYPQWWGGLCWGPRLLLPIVPFMILLALPLFDRLVSGIRRNGAKSLHKRVAGVLCVLVIGISLLVQVTGLSMDPSIHELALASRIMGELDTTDSQRVIGAMAFDWYNSPILAHVRLLVHDGALPDYKWLMKIEDRISILWIPLTLGVLWLAISGAMGTLVARRPSVGRMWLTLAPPAFVLMASLQLSAYREGAPESRADGLDWALAPLIQHINRDASRDDILIVSSAQHPHIYFDRLTSPVEWYGLLEEEYPPEERTVQLLDSLLSRGDRVFLARDRRQEADEYRGIERYLVERAYLLDDRLFADWSRLMTFLPSRGTTVAQRRVLTLFGGEVALNEYRLQLEGRPITGDASEGWLLYDPSAWVQLSVRWRSMQRMETDYTVFLQLLDEHNTVVWQKDRYPLEGFRPTSSWGACEIIEDIYAIPLDPLPPGKYRLIIGLYDLETLDRLSTGLDDALLLAEIAITPPSDRKAAGIKISVSDPIRPTENELYLPLVVFHRAVSDLLWCP